MEGGRKGKRPLMNEASSNTLPPSFRASCMTRQISSITMRTPPLLPPAAATFFLIK
jgi:hypothetical protein